MPMPRKNPRLYALKKYGNVGVLITPDPEHPGAFQLRFADDHLHRKTVDAMQSLPLGASSRADVLRDGVLIASSNNLPPMHAREFARLSSGGLNVRVRLDPWAVAHYYGGDAHLVFETADC